MLVENEYLIYLEVRSEYFILLIMMFTDVKLPESVWAIVSGTVM